MANLVGGHLWRARCGNFSKAPKPLRGVGRKTNIRSSPGALFSRFPKSLLGPLRSRRRYDINLRSEIVKNQLSVSRQVPGSPSTPLISLVHSVGLGERQRISDHAVVASVGHDGRARTITDAIRAHSCQADAARAAFEALTRQTGRRPSIS